MILITGATGLVGRQLTPHLLAAGWPVRVMVQPRRGGRAPHLPWPEELGVEVMTGDLEDPASLHPAMQNVHTVFHLASAQWWGTRRDLEQVDIQGTRNVIAAARSARIGRLYLPQPAWGRAVVRLYADAR